MFISPKATVFFLWAFSDVLASTWNVFHPSLVFAAKLSFNFQVLVSLLFTLENFPSAATFQPYSAKSGVIFIPIDFHNIYNFHCHVLHFFHLGEFTEHLSSLCHVLHPVMS